MGLLRHTGIVVERGAFGRVQHQDGLPLSVCVGYGQIDQGLTKLLAGRLWVSVLSDVVVLCVLHALVLTPLAVLAARHLDSVVRAWVGHIQATARTAGLRQRKDRLRVWTGEEG